MSKITAALLAAFVSFKSFASKVTVRIHAFLIDLHVSNLVALINKAERRVERLLGVAEYHKAAAIEATTVADEASRTADAVTAQVTKQAAALGVTL